ncbi:hypothetical protein KP509_16G012400 [Ceratopteris richardii]|uniref:F-box domain-containing protein n=1 Tax=Ceratopteris richardii TaxID=49495 RepID=A0A8T2SWR6_CERRI|nr:hypothetical protein KP509_16G012400 [Ceratopteris richardii]
MKRHRPEESSASINILDDGCLVRIFSFLIPLPARVCRRWHGLASDRRMWLRVENQMNVSLLQPLVFPTLQDAVTAAKPGDTIIISSGETHISSNIFIDKPLCLLGDGMSPEDTLLFCPRGFESALEFSASSRVANLTILAELGTCLLHRKGSLVVENCALRCREHPLEHLSCAIVSTADAVPTSFMLHRNGVSVVETKIEGGKEAVRTSGNLVLQEVRVVYARAALVFWFNVSQKCLTGFEPSCQVGKS